MDAKDQLARRIASANEQLRAAQRNGRCKDILAWRERRDELLDQWPRENPTAHGRTECKPTQSA